MRYCIIILLATTAFCNRLSACNIPVFRYALERWVADSYPVVVYHNGTLDPQTIAALEALNAAENHPEYAANINVHQVNVNQPETGTEDWLARHPKAANLTTSEIVVFFPQRTGIEAPVWYGPATLAAVRRIVDSPTRREVMQRLLAGESAVWLVLTTGDSAKDATAEQALRTELNTLNSQLSLPEGIVQADTLVSAVPGADYDDKLVSSIPLTVQFSVLPLDRRAPDEAVFVNMLLGLEADLAEFDDEPIAIPIFGRGRAHLALIGSGITTANLNESCGYLIGACSCQVKEENPGTDLLMSINWDEFVRGTITADKILPPLSGAADLLAATAPPTTPVAPSTVTDVGVADEQRPQWPMIGLATIVVIIGALFVGTVALKRRSPS